MSLSQDIESRINILDVVSKYVELKKAGVNYKGLCPFHSEKSPSFIVSPQKNIAHCFSCGKGGGPIKFLMEIEKVEFREAISVLAKEAGVELKTDFMKERQEKGEDIYALYREAAGWYHRSLFEKENETYLNYLLERKISRDTIIKFQLGCSTDSRGLYFFLKEKGFESKFLLESGIFLTESRDKFFGRITFPIANSMGHVVAFTGRVLDNALPKYLNSPASHIFDKSSTLYGMHLAKQSIAKTGEVYVVEGQMDTITLHQAGIDNAVGISGTALTTEHIQMLKRSVKTIYLTLDADSAGVKATFASIENLQNQDMEMRIIRIPNGKDPDEYIKSGANFTDLKSTSLTPIAFYLAEGNREFDITTIVGKKKLIEKCLEFLTPIRSQIEVSLHIREMSRKLDVGEDAIYTEYKKAMQYSRTKKKYDTHEKLNQEVISPLTFTPAEFLAGYILRYDFLDLFFQEFRYTREDLSLEGDFSLLCAVLSGEALDLEESERIKVIILSIESSYPDEERESSLIRKAFSDNIKNIHTSLLRKSYEKAIQENPDQTLQIKIQFIQKAKEFGFENAQSLFR